MEKKKLIIIYSKLGQLLLVAQSCLTLCDPLNCSPPGSSVCGILQSRILEWVVISFPRGSSQPGDRALASCIACWFLPSEQPGKPVMCTKKVNSRFSVLCLRDKESFQQNKILSTNKQWSLIYRFSESVLSVKHITCILVRKCFFPWSLAALSPITEATLLSSD